MKDDKTAHAVIALMLMPVVIFVAGLSISTNWNWFAVPLGAPSITIAHGYGLCLLASLLRPVVLMKGQEIDSGIMVMLQHIAGGLFGMLFGWIMHSVMG